MTTLDKNQSQAYSFSVNEHSAIDVGGFTNSVGTVSEALDVKSIQISGIEIIEPVIYSTDLGKLVSFIENCTHKRISGIIGVPVLKRHQLVIDLSCDRLYKSTGRE